MDESAVEIIMSNAEIVRWQEMQKKSVECLVRKRKALRARYTYGIIFLLINLVAWFLRDYGQWVLPQLHYIKSCGIEGHDCFRTMGVLRVSLGCFIFFFIMLLTTCRTSKLFEARSTWHSGWWALKLLIFVISLVISFFVPSDFIQLYGELARVGAGIFLILQLISVIEFIAWWNTYWMPDEIKKQSCFLGLFMSTLFYIASFCGIVTMYVLYAPSTSCTLNIFFITWTAILLLVMMVISLHSKVNRGLLSSGIMASYIVFLCWSAIRSEPVLEKCSPQKKDNRHSDWTTVLGFLIAIFAIVMATFSTGIDSQTFQFRKREVELEEDDIPYKYGFFHLIFSLGAMYFAMLFISWNLDSSTRKWSIDVGWASTWVKVVNEWFAATIYRTMFAGNINTNNNNGRNIATQLGPDGLGLGFGTITVIDDYLTLAPELGSQSVGKAQGVYVASSADGSTQMMTFTAMIEGGEYGDSINFFGVYRIQSTMSRLSVTGGTGKFKNACGFAEVRSLIPAGQTVADGIEMLLRLTVHLTY